MLTGRSSSTWSEQSCGVSSSTCASSNAREQSHRPVRRRLRIQPQLRPIPKARLAVPPSPISTSSRWFLHGLRSKVRRCGRRSYPNSYPRRTETETCAICSAARTRKACHPVPSRHSLAIDLDGRPPCDAPRKVWALLHVRHPTHPRGHAASRRPPLCPPGRSRLIRIFERNHQSLASFGHPVCRIVSRRAARLGTRTHQDRAESGEEPSATGRDRQGHLVANVRGRIPRGSVSLLSCSLSIYQIRRLKGLLAAAGRDARRKRLTTVGR